MKHFLLSFLVITSFSVFSQITIDENDFPSADDTAMISVSDVTVLDLTTVGADVSWDYSGINIAYQRIDTFYNVSDASLSYQYFYNNAFLYPENQADYYYNLVGFDLAGLGGTGITISSPVAFTQVSSSMVENVGIGLVLNGFELPMAADTNDVEFELPMNYSDSWSSNSYIYVDLTPSGFDGIFIRHQQRLSIVDSWGEITTEFGAFDVVRVKSLLSFDDSVYFDPGFGGMWFELPTPDQIEYTWWSKNNKVPVMRVVTQDDGGTETVTRVEFKDKFRNIVGIEDNVAFQGQMSPNPANDQVNFTFEDGVKEIMIYSVSGELVYHNSITQSTLNLNTANWSEGLYMVKLIGEKTVSSTKLIIN